ncbi:MAG: biotin carboxylase, partial [FCB group bacterium]
MRKADRKKITVAITGLNAIDSPGPGIAVIRCLKEMNDYNVKIIGLSYESLEPGIYMKNLVKKTYQIPYPSAGIESLLNRLEYIHYKEKLDLIIPNFDAELYNFIKITNKLDSLGIKTVLPTLSQFQERDKINLVKLGEKIGLDVPKDAKIHSIDKLKTIEDDFEFPMVIKGKYYDATIVHTHEQARNAFHKLNAKWGLPVIVQEFIEGMEINIAGLGDGTGKALSIIPMRKMYITDNGKAWAGITLDDKSLIQITKKFIKAT